MTCCFCVHVFGIAIWFMLLDMYVSYRSLLGLGVVANCLSFMLNAVFCIRYFYLLVNKFGFLGQAVS